MFPPPQTRALLPQLTKHAQAPHTVNLVSHSHWLCSFPRASLRTGIAAQCIIPPPPRATPLGRTGAI